MICTFFEEFLDYPVFDQFPKSDRNFIPDFISGSEAMDAEVVTTEGPMSEVVMEVEGATLDITKVLAEVPKSPRMPRPKPTLTKESAKDKKGKQALIPVHVSPRRNTQNDKPTTQEKGKAINLEPKEEEIKGIPMDDEDVGIDMEEVEA